METKNRYKIITPSPEKNRYNIIPNTPDKFVSTPPGQNYSTVGTAADLLLKPSKKIAQMAYSKPIATYPEKSVEKEVSAAHVFGQEAAYGTVPTVGGLAAGAATMTAAAPLATIPVVGVPLVIGAGIIGAIGGATLIEKAQNWAIGAVAGKEKQARMEQERAVESAQHPVAAFAGSLAPQLLVMKPSPKNVINATNFAKTLFTTTDKIALQKLITSPVGRNELNNLINVSLGGGLQGGQEFINQVKTGDYNATRLLAQTVIGAVISEPNRFGVKLGMHPTGDITIHEDTTAGNASPPDKQPIPISESKILPEVNKTIDINKASIEQGPGHQKFSDALDLMVKQRTLHPEDAEIAKIVFKDTNDEWLGTLRPESNPYISRTGNADYEKRTMTVRKGTVDLAKGDEWWSRPEIEPVMTLFHEYGHLADKFILDPSEHAIVGEVYRELGKKQIKSIFAAGMGEKPENVSYYAKNQEEFLVQSLAEYIMQNKVPAEKMRPLLERLAVRFWEAVKNLVNRKDTAAMKRLAPIFEKMLSGEKNKPLSEFMSGQPPNFKNELKAMLDSTPKPLPGIFVKPRDSKVTLPPSKFETPKEVVPPLPPETLQQKIIRAREEQAAIERSNITAPLPIEFPLQAKEIRNGLLNSQIPDNINNYKDIGTVEKGFADVFRNTEKVFGKNSVPEKLVLNPFDKSKGAFIDRQNRETLILKEGVINKFKFKPGSKESAAIELYGEGKMKFEELVKKFGDKKANQIVEADSFFRENYDRILLNEVNKTEQQIYPNSPYKWTPKLENYYRHGQLARGDFSRLQNILETPIKIDPLLVGKTETTQPKSRWASFKQRRFTDTHKPDAIGNYLEYIKASSYTIEIDPNIGNIRELGEFLARGTGTRKNLNNYIESLNDLANNLSGKSSDIDRLVSKYIPGGRTALAATTWLNNRVKANTILFNAKASLAQILNLPPALREMGIIGSSKALAKTTTQIFLGNKPMAESNFLKERYFKGYNQFDTGIMNDTRKAAIWMVGTLDEASTKMIWNGQYDIALNKKVDNPVIYADKATRKLVAGRGIGEKPTVQNSNVMQIVMPFQYEMTNLWWVMRDMAKEDKGVIKKFGSFATLFLINWFFNDVFEKTTGTRPLLDPYDAISDSIAEMQASRDWTGTTKAGGRLFGEVISNLPLGSTIASAYPEYGTSILGVKVPTRKEFFGESDPTRFGGGLLSTQALFDPLFKIAPPFGGLQLKKTFQGIGTVAQGKSTSISDKFQYKVDKTLPNYIQGGLFGKYALPQSQKYYKKQETPKKTNTKNSKNRYEIL